MLSKQSAFDEISHCQEQDFIRAKVDGVHIYNCYARPPLSWEDFGELLQNLASDAVNRNRKIIAGDFHAWSTDWGSKRTKARGKLVVDTMELELSERVKIRESE